MTATETDLAQLLEQAHQLVQVGAIYVHYRNPYQPYKVLALALLESTEQVSVVYQAEYGSQLTWIRPLDSWLSFVDTNGTQVPRFQRLVT